MIFEEMDRLRKERAALGAMLVAGRLTEHFIDSLFCVDGVILAESVVRIMARGEAVTIKSVIREMQIRSLEPEKSDHDAAVDLLEPLLEDEEGIQAFLCWHIQQPPVSDSCEMLAAKLVEKRHAFLARDVYMFEHIDTISQLVCSDPKRVH